MIEKLIGLLSDYFNIGDSYHYTLGRNKEAFGMGTMSLYDFTEYGEDDAADLAEFLMDNGVTVQRWIPVSEGLPKTIPCGAGTKYSEAVNVLTAGRKVLTAIFDGTDFIADAEFWDADGEEITHWTPVLLPLPEPPKEVE